MSARRSLRRQFLKDGAALAGFAAGAISSPGGKLFAGDASPTDLHAYGQRSHFESDVRVGSIAMWPIVPGAQRDYGFRSPLQDSLGIITPAPLHFIISHGHEPPDMDPREHRLMIHGMVDRPLIFTLDEVKRRRPCRGCTSSNATATAPLQALPASRGKHQQLLSRKLTALPVAASGLGCHSRSCWARWACRKARAGS